MMNLENKNVVVTGASSGIGLELVKGFLSKGCGSWPQA
jgi:NAD(P)-dependent dehydrogenase (short-subunit alcohol dehydrogenase family)